MEDEDYNSLISCLADSDDYASYASSGIFKYQIAMTQSEKLLAVRYIGFEI